MNSASARLGIESYSPINGFLLIEFHTEDTCAHSFVLLFGSETEGEVLSVILV